MPDRSPPLDSADACYAALCAHDRRFDGRFFVGVTSTGIYCRPICPARTPRAANCRYFAHAAAAEAAGFRPCLRCRPELAPGHASVDASSRLAWAAVQGLQADPACTVSTLAARLQVSDRHLRRVFLHHCGVGPNAFAQTQRLLLAKRLLSDTHLPISDIAYAAGFGSLRRFNTAFLQHYQLAPSALRKNIPPHAAAPAGGAVFELAYRPPFDWPRLLSFLAQRSIRGVEAVHDGRYSRSLRLATAQGLRTGLIQIGHRPERCSLAVEISAELLPGIAAVLSGVRRLFDLDGEPQAVLATLGELAADAPGLRVPGAFDGFEMAVRAILGQQVTVKAAHTLAGRLAAHFGEPLPPALLTSGSTLSHLFPDTATLAAADPATLGALGIVRQRSKAIIALAAAVASGQITLSPVADLPTTLRQLQALPGIGRWTAQYIALRALAWPDAWPSGDVALIKALDVSDARSAYTHAERWRPWRAYAVLHLWRRLSENPSTVPSSPQSPARR